MLKAGEVYENPVTGERAVARIGTDTTGGERLVVDLYVQPGGAVMGEHFHPGMEERFTVLNGQVGFRLAGRVAIAEPRDELIAPEGKPLRSVHRLDEPTGLSLGMIASPQCLLPFRPARSV